MLESMVITWLLKQLWCSNCDDSREADGEEGREVSGAECSESVESRHGYHSNRAAQVCKEEPNS